MPPIEIRPFRRSDRDQLTELVNAHVDAVLPGVSVSPNAVLSQLEREPDEYVVDPWVIARQTLVAVARDHVVGGVHLLRYGDAAAVADGYRNAGELRWLLFWPTPGSDGTADALTAAGLAALRQWGVSSVRSDGGLPTPGTYGVPDRWPHVAAAMERAGFTPGDRIEAVLVAPVDALPPAGSAPLDGLTLRVALGGHATRFSAVLDERVVGCYEVRSDLTAGGTLSRLAGWGEGWELWVEREHQRRGIATWLVGQAAARLRLGGVQRVLDYAIVAPDDDVEPGLLPFLHRAGFTELARTRRGWTIEGFVGDGVLGEQPELLGGRVNVGRVDVAAARAVRVGEQGRGEVADRPGDERAVAAVLGDGTVARSHPPGWSCSTSWPCAGEDLRGRPYWACREHLETSSVASLPRWR